MNTNQGGNTMKLLLVADDGEVMGSSDEFTQQEWVNMAAGYAPAGAAALLGSIS